VRTKLLCTYAVSHLYIAVMASNMSYIRFKSSGVLHHVNW